MSGFFKKYWVYFAGPAVWLLLLIDYLHDGCITAPLSADVENCVQGPSTFLVGAFVVLVVLGTLLVRKMKKKVNKI